MSNREKLPEDLISKLKVNLNEVKGEAVKNFSKFSGYDSKTAALKKIVDSIERFESDLKRNCTFK